MFGHDCDLVAIHTEDFSLEVDQLPLTHFHIVPGLEVMLSLLTCRNSPQPSFTSLKSAHRAQQKTRAMTTQNTYELGNSTCGFCDHLQINALWLVLKLFQF